ncbi:diguanylate phosphodiesterase [Salinivibrio sp. IB574]|uniref:EAL domain-containing protein n=1 Tax=Salinivibrio sp. IB574 TaxID=1909444 RepID=UPI0009893DD6|nr:EAL domain-containing protein [Salinivibrio sp. IB574]OOF23663.1 diguanylate phosphodiesterase [Salinivibrio sp. IB574]
MTHSASQCDACKNKKPLPFAFSMAFQPIVQLSTGRVFAYEALVRGMDGSGAGSVFKHVNADNQYQFDQTCRIKAVSLAAKLEIPCFLSINFMPNAVYEPERCIQTTLKAAREHQFPLDRILFEFTEGEEVLDYGHIQRIIRYYRSQGFITAIDDFGAGYSGLTALANIDTNIIKIDMALVRDIDTDPVKQAIVRHSVAMCEELGRQIIAEGIETEKELRCLHDLGIDFFQGYYIAKPEFEALPAINQAPGLDIFHRQ